MQAFTFASTPRHRLSVITEKPLQGGFPITTLASTRDHVSPGPTSARQRSPSSARFASQLARPNPPGSSRFPTSSKPACTTPRVNPPANPRQSTNVYGIYHLPLDVKRRGLRRGAVPRPRVAGAISDRPGHHHYQRVARHPAGSTHDLLDESLRFGRLGVGLGDPREI